MIYKFRDLNRNDATIEFEVLVSKNHLSITYNGTDGQVSINLSKVDADKLRSALYEMIEELKKDE